MVNLYDNVMDALLEHDLTPADVKWVGSVDFKTTWENFAEIALKTEAEYDLPIIPYDLIIVGEDWWLEYAGCDGVFWLELKRYPKPPSQTLPIKNLYANDSTYGLGISLADINGYS